MKQRIFSSLTTVVLLLAATVFVGSTTASAAADALCDPPGYYNASSSTAIILRSHYIKDAPYAACGNVAWVNEGAKVYIWCSTVNKYGNMWLYARIAGTSTRGWISMDNMEVTGGAFPCGDPF